MTMTSETAQELREGGSSKPRAIEYAGHTLKVGTIWFSSIVNLHCRTYDTLRKLNLKNYTILLGPWEDLELCYTKQSKFYCISSRLIYQ